MKGGSGSDNGGSQVLGFGKRIDGVRVRREHGEEGVSEFRGIRVLSRNWRRREERGFRLIERVFQTIEEANGALLRGKAGGRVRGDTVELAFDGGAYRYCLVLPTEGPKGTHTNALEWISVHVVMKPKPEIRRNTLN